MKQNTQLDPISELPKNEEGEAENTFWGQSPLQRDKNTRTSLNGLILEKTDSERIKESIHTSQIQFLKNATIKDISWENIREQLKNPDFKKSKFFKKLNEKEFKKLETCIKVEEELERTTF